MRRFEENAIWKDAIELSRIIYILSKKFPNDEKFGLTSQIKRSSNSVSANFAEGFGRYSKNDKHHFYVIAHGSLLETKNFLYLAVALEFVDKAAIESAILHIEALEKQLNSLKKALRS